MKIGAEIKKARKGFGMTQAEYGARVGLTQQRVCELENDAPIGARTLERLISKGGIRWTDKGPRARAA